MASVKTTVVRKPKGTSIWNIEKLGNTVFKFETSSSKKAKIVFAGKEWEIDKYYLSLPSTFTNREINYILTEMEAADLISAASISIDYSSKFEIFRKESEKITISKLRDDYYRSEYIKLQKEFADKIETIIDINTMIAPYTWQITPIYDPVTINNITIPVTRGNRVFVLQII